MREIPGAEMLQRIYPLNRLAPAALAELEPALSLRRYSAGRDLFELLANDDDYYYVLSGSVRLADETQKRFHLIEPAQGEAMALPFVVPGIQYARAVSDTQVLVVDREQLEAALCRHLPDSAQSLELAFQAGATDGDWQAALRRAPGFQRVPWYDLRRAFSRMEAVPVRAGEHVIRAGDAGDCAFVIAAGRCEVLRGSGAGDKAVRITEYGTGALIGEDAVISGHPRNADVRMLEDGCLMRIAADDCRYLLMRPPLLGVDLPEARRRVAAGARWLDVRMPAERGVGPRRDCIAMPHPVVRARLFSADPAHRYVVACASGRDSAVIAFTLSKYGYDACYLQRGLDGLPAESFP